MDAQTRRESEGIESLARQGYVTYLPRFQKRRRHARKIDTVTCALFPRYLFVLIDTTCQRWRSILSTVGVSQLICDADGPVAMPCEVISQLRSREDEKGFIRMETQRFMPGDRIRIEDGAFADCLASVVGMTDAERVTVLLDLLGRKVRVALDAEMLSAA